MLIENTNLPLNFRDVGEFINCIAGQKLMHENKLFRGGKIQALDSLSSLRNPKTIINLRNSPDPIHKFPGITHLHFSIRNSVEKYDTRLPDVKYWLNKTLSALADPQLALPAYLHCASGKDRTGVVVASLLFLLGIPEIIIQEEYLLSEGETSLPLLGQSLSGIKSNRNYFNRVDHEQLKKQFLIK